MKLPVHLREITADDILPLHHACWPESDPELTYAHIENILRWRRRERAWGIVAEYQMQLVGFAQFTHWNGRGEISDLIVSLPHQGQGIGSALILYMLNLARQQQIALVEIGVARSNPGALRLYQKLGFVEQYEIEIDLGKGKEPVVYLAHQHMDEQWQKSIG